MLHAFKKKKQLYNMSFYELYLFYLGFRIFMLSIIIQFHFVTVLLRLMLLFFLFNRILNRRENAANLC